MHKQNGSPICREQQIPGKTVSRKNSGDAASGNSQPGVAQHSESSRQNGAITTGEELAFAKLRFAKAAEAIQPMRFARERPLTSLCGAFMLGFGLSNLRDNGKMIPIVPMLLDLSTALLRLKSLFGIREKTE